MGAATITIKMKRHTAFVIDAVLRACTSGRGAKILRLALRDKLGKVWPDLAVDFEGFRLADSQTAKSGSIDVTRQELEAVKMGILGLLQGESTNGQDDANCRRVARVFGLWEKHICPYLKPDDIAELSGELDFEEDILDTVSPEEG
jgi:hypothetical protein